MNAIIIEINFYILEKLIYFFQFIKQKFLI